MTHMIIGKLTSGPKDWGHWTLGADGAYKYSLAQASPEFLQLLKHFGQLPE
jgi:VCBS repeat-containing protein